MSKKNLFPLLFYIAIALIHFRVHTRASYRMAPNTHLPQIFATSPKLVGLHVEGLQYVPVEAVLAKLPIAADQPLDPKQVSLCIPNLLSLGCFSDVRLEYTKSDDASRIVLYIVVKEKKRLSSLSFKGNENLSAETIEKKQAFSKLHWIDEKDVQVILKKLKKMYVDKQYHAVSFSYEMLPREDGTIDLVITVHEGNPSRIQSIQFVGNHSISRHQLKKIIASKEYWLLGFFDRGGLYKQEMTEYDKYQIESFYQSKGYFQAHVKDALIKRDTDGTINITYIIEEGPLYKFGKILVPDIPHINPLIVDQQVRFDTGDLYSKQALHQSITNIKNLLGEQGYINATVSPKMKINQKTCTIDIEFFVNPGKPVYINRIDIAGNTKTKERVIRRELIINEGDLLTTQKLESSKQAISSLGYFVPQTGVSWSTHAFDTHQANLKLKVQEMKTGKFFLKVSLNSGSDAGKRWQTVTGGPRWYDTILTNSNIGITLQNINWRGRGIKYYLDGNYASVDRSLSCGMSTNWLLDWPVSAGWNALIRTMKYEDFHQSTTIPHERTLGGNIQLGFRPQAWNMALVGLSTGFDRITYEHPIAPKIAFEDDPAYQAAFSEIVRRSFQPGTITWITGSVSDDKRNHPVRPTEGYQWIIDAKCAIPNTWSSDTQKFGFIRAGIDARWYTPLLISHNLVFHLHGYAGFIHPFPGSTVPYKELFHVGGPQSVRGFTFGQIGPSLLGSSLGSKKAFYVNAELQCPINPDGSIMGVLFYDGGAAWDTIFNSTYIIPGTNHAISTLDLIQNNEINYRHAVGFGIRLTSPMPIKIDWGFKLDRHRRERLFEVHISMEQSY